MQSYFPSFGWAKDVNFEQFSVDRDRTVPRDLKLSRRDNGFPQSRDLCATIHQCEIIAKLSVARPHNAGFMLTIFATHGNHRLFVFAREGGEVNTEIAGFRCIDDPPWGTKKEEYLHQLDRLLRIVFGYWGQEPPVSGNCITLYTNTHKVLPARNFYSFI